MGPDVFTYAHVQFPVTFPRGTEIHKVWKYIWKGLITIHCFPTCAQHRCQLCQTRKQNSCCGCAVMWVMRSHLIHFKFNIFSSHKRGKRCLKLGLVVQAIPIILFCLIIQELEVGTNPVQVETGEFDEAIEVVEDVIAESKFNVFSTPPAIFHCFEAVFNTPKLQIYFLSRDLSALSLCTSEVVITCVDYIVEVHETMGNNRLQISQK